MKLQRRRLAAASVIVLGVVGIALLANPPNSVSRSGHVVRVAEGALRGSIEDDLNVYRGVPFAAPPVGELRWRAPQAVQAWSGIKEVVEFKPRCMQTGGSIPGMASALPTSEDCLYLNLWAPREHANAVLPVMVYLHGGGGVNGSPSERPYWGHRLARRGVIVVGLSYRLGAFGYLAHPELTAEAGISGNYGLLDVIAGLAWIRQNIAAFGGDASNVTLFGHSAGAFLASKLMISPRAQGLFHRVIGMAGGDTGPSGTTEGIAVLADAEAAGLEFAKSLGADSIRALRAISAAAIQRAERPRIANSNDTRFLIVDGTVIPHDSHSAYEQGLITHVPLLVGYNSAEGKNLVANYLSAQQYVTAISDRYGESAGAVLEEFPAATDAEARESQSRHAGETIIKWHVATWARLHARHARADVYAYVFDQTPPIGPLRKLGPAHGAEIPYVFEYPFPNVVRNLLSLPPRSLRDARLAEQIQTYWTNFAKTGDPNGQTVPHWPAFSKAMQVMNLSSQSSLIDMPDAKAHALIDAFISSMRERRVRQNAATGQDAQR